MTIMSDCGHHCGIITSGAVRFESHCNEKCCHNGNAPDNVTSIIGDENAAKVL